MINAFVDTNVFVYAVDSDEPEKRGCETPDRNRAARRVERADCGLVSRTVTYSVVVTVLVGVYAGAVGGMTQLLPLPSDFAVAAATLVAAAAFSPLRRKVQRQADRRFNRTRFDADREVEVCPLYARLAASTRRGIRLVARCSQRR
jgi:predicted nucleic acid-binding protein